MNHINNHKLNCCILQLLLCCQNESVLKRTPSLNRLHNSVGSVTLVSSIIGISVKRVHIRHIQIKVIRIH